MSQEAIKKLAGIFEKQQKILQKLAYPPISLHEARQLFGLPADFDYETAKEAVNRYVTEHRNKPDWNAKSVTFNRALVTLEDDFRYRERAKERAKEMSQDIPQDSPEDSQSLPPDFDNALNHYKEKQQEALENPARHSDFRMTLNQLARMAEGEKAIWEELGEYFPGWTPNNIRQLLSKLRG